VPQVSSISTEIANIDVTREHYIALHYVFEFLCCLDSSFLPPPPTSSYPHVVKAHTNWPWEIVQDSFVECVNRLWPVSTATVSETYEKQQATHTVCTTGWTERLCAIYIQKKNTYLILWSEIWVSLRWKFKSWSSGLWRRVVLWWDTNVSQVHAASSVKWRHEVRISAQILNNTLTDCSL
jgi:hypothetical protein